MFWLNLNVNKDFNGYLVKGLDAAENYEVFDIRRRTLPFPNHVLRTVREPIALSYLKVRTLVLTIYSPKRLMLWRTRHAKKVYCSTHG